MFGVDVIGVLVFVLFLVQRAGAVVRQNPGVSGAGGRSGGF